MASAPKVRNKRLSQGDRDTIVRFAKKQIESTQDATELDAAYDRVADAIHGAVIAKWPQKDMQVLARYDAASKDSCIYISTGGYNYDRFEFRSGDKRIVLRPNRSGCHRIPIMLEGDADEAYKAFKSAQEQYDEAKKKRLNDFCALIASVNSFNALAEVWPAVETLREAIVGTGAALAVFSSEVMDRIKSDAAFQAEAA